VFGRRTAPRSCRVAAVPWTRYDIRAVAGHRALFVSKTALTAAAGSRLPAAMMWPDAE